MGTLRRRGTLSSQGDSHRRGTLSAVFAPVPIGARGAHPIANRRVNVRRQLWPATISKGTGSSASTAERRHRRQCHQATSASAPPTPGVSLRPLAWFPDVRPHLLSFDALSLEFGANAVGGVEVALALRFDPPGGVSRHKPAERC